MVITKQLKVDDSSTSESERFHLIYKLNEAFAMLKHGDCSHDHTDDLEEIIKEIALGVTGSKIVFKRE